MNMQHDLLTLVSFALPEESRLITSTLRRLDYQVELCDSSRWLSEINKYISPLLVFVFRSNNSLCAEITKHLQQRKFLPPFIILLGDKSKWDPELLSGYGDFIFWPCDEIELRCRLQCVFEVRDDIRIDLYCSKNHPDYTDLNLIGNSPEFTRVRQQVKKLAQCDTAVLIEGDTGTGKEMIARSIHYNSNRQGNPFIPINCGALPDDLMENELFGHKKGAFTDAKDSTKGLVSQAEGGTLFLDEVESLSLKGQVALLRFLESHEYRPIGSDKTLFTNTRIITASNKSLLRLIENGHFREDLYFRLNVMSITLPALKNRTGDIQLLAEYFMEIYREQYNQPDKRIHPETIFLMESYHWPGNVRELENFTHREFLLAESSVIKVDSINNLTNKVEHNNDDYIPQLFSEIDFNQAKAQVISHFEKQYLQNLMLQSNGNVTYAARQAGKERRALGKLLKKHGINKKEYC